MIPWNNKRYAVARIQFQRMTGHKQSRPSPNSTEFSWRHSRQKIPHSAELVIRGAYGLATNGLRLRKSLKTAYSVRKVCAGSVDAAFRAGIIPASDDAIPSDKIAITITAAFTPLIS
jgi:hypothetical protein